MARKDDLEGLIRGAYKLIREYEEVEHLSDDPKERERARREMEGEWARIRKWLAEYLPLCKRLGEPPPDDIAQIAARFEGREGDSWLVAPRPCPDPGGGAGQPLPPNPFVPLTGRIGTPDQVFDREQEVDEALAFLRSGGSVAFIGPTGVGKSSLLTALMARVREELTWETVYLDLQIPANGDQFRAELCGRLGVPVCRGVDLQRALTGRRVLLCLDEVEKLSWDDEGFTFALRAELRGLAEGPEAPFKLALAARTPLDELFPDSPGRTSPLDSICLQVDVERWSEDTARRFLLDRLAGTNVCFTEGEIARLVTESGGHPMRLVQAAHRLYRERGGGAR